MTASRHAYLILAHDNFYVLDKLLRLLDDPRNSIYLHVDAKASGFDPEPLHRACRHSTLNLVPRIPIYWGDYSQLEGTFRLLERATADRHDYYHLLSAADLPLQTQDAIHAFFDRHSGTEFVGFASDFDPRCVQQIHLWTRHLKPRHRWVGRLRSVLANGFIRLQRAVRYDRTRRFGMEVRKGSDWYSITHALAEHLLANEPTARRLLKHALVPSEFVVQTLVWNSPFRDRVHDLGDEYSSNLRLIDWQRGDPYVFRRADLPALTGSGRLFARKFQARIDRDVVDALYEHLAEKQGRAAA